MTPLTPAEVQVASSPQLDAYIDIFNKILINKGQGYIVILRKEVQAMFGDDFDPSLACAAANKFRNYGWKVDFDSPGYNESYEPSWSFKKA